LARTFRSTNAIESMIGVCRQRSANVKRWRDGDMAMRWCAAGMVEAGKQESGTNWGRQGAAGGWLAPPLVSRLRPHC